MSKKFFAFLPYGICFVVFLCFATLSVVKHMHFFSGYDLSIVDQITWKYSSFQAPITTTHAYAFTHALTDHVEFIWILLSPLYWIFPSALTLIVAQAAAISASGIPVYLLAKRKKVKESVSLALLVSYLLFYGIQFAIWSDVHSLVFAASFLPWFLYFLDKKEYGKTTLFFILAILCKEDIALFTLCISMLYVIFQKRKDALVFATISVVYLIFLFFIYYPLLTTDGYRYQNESGLLSNISLSGFFDTADKRSVLFYTLSWFGGISLLSLFYLLAALADIAHYFILGSPHTSAHGLFGHYRSTLALFMVWPAILAIARFRLLNNKVVAVYILCMALLFQYILHLPLSYLSKQWFWQEPSGVKNMQQVIASIPPDSALVAQSNIAPHVTHRDMIFTLWPEIRTFENNSPCRKRDCYAFRWVGNPQYLIVDTSTEWDIRHLLANREEYLEAISVMEQLGAIQKEKQIGTTTLYKIVKSNR